MKAASTAAYPSTPHLFIEDHLPQLMDAELLRLRAALEVELKKRNIAFTIGQMGEQFAIDYFNRTPGNPNLMCAPAGTTNVDALSRRGERYSIKTLCKAKKTGTVYPDAADRDKQLFEYLLIVRMNQDWSLDAIYEFDWNTFVQNRKWDKRMNAWYLGASKKTLAAARKYTNGA